MTHYLVNQHNITYILRNSIGNRFLYLEILGKGFELHVICLSLISTKALSLPPKEKYKNSFIYVKNVFRKSTLRFRKACWRF